MSNKPAFDPALRALAARARRDLDDHPSPEALVSYHAGELPAGAEETLRDHLALCPDCAEMLLDLVSFAHYTPPQEAAILTDGEVESAWQKVQPRLKAKERPVVEPMRRDAGYEVVHWRRKVRVAYALAATLFFGVVGLSVWAGSLHKKVEQASGPWINVSQQLLDPEGEGKTRGGNESANPLRVSAGVPLFLALNLFDVKVYPEYAVEIVDGGGHTVWQSRRLVRNPDNAVTFQLPGGFLAPGEHKIQLFGVDHDQRQPLTVFRLLVDPEGSP